VIDAVFAELLVRVHDRFGVGVCPENVTSRLERVSQLTMVVHFAVEDDPDRSVFIRQRLLAAGAVDDGKPPMGEGDPRAIEKPFAVGTAMCNASRHRGNRRPDGRIELTRQADNATDATHGSHSHQMAKGREYEEKPAKCDAERLHLTEAKGRPRVGLWSGGLRGVSPQ
jgi:hypothetical protein